MYHVLQFLNENLESKITQREVASMFGYSIAYFSEKFKLYTGCTFHEYMNRRRMQYAAKCLIEGKKITDIAFDLGYNSINGFKKAFKNEFGIFPTQYKKQEKADRKCKINRLPQRCTKLIENVTSRNVLRKYRGQYLYNFMKGYYSVPIKERNQRRLLTASICSVIDNFTPYIEEEELIVGYNYDNEEQEINGYAHKTVSEYNSLKMYLQDSLLPSGQVDEILTCITDETDGYAPNYMLYDVNPEYRLRDDGSGKFNDMYHDMALNGMCKINNHCIPDYKIILEKGFQGLRDELVVKYNDTNDDFYGDLIKLCQSCMRIGEKYAACAEQMAQETENTTEKERLLKIAQVCSRVPRYPATNLYEAIQSIYFTHIINTWEDGVNANSLGRLDQILYPYYCNDIEKGVINNEEAYELLCCLWIKLYKTYDVQNITIGGCDSKGHDAVNELSYMILDCLENINLVRSLSVRYSRVTDRAFMHRCFSVLKNIRNGQPSFCNDDVMIPALVSKGIQWEDATDYALLGCVEPTIPGRANSHSSTANMNVVKAIEYTLGQGRSLCQPNLSDGVITKDPCLFRSFNEFLQAVYIHLEQIVNATCEFVDSLAQYVVEHASLPYKTLLTEGCIASGVDYAQGGTKYNYYQIMISGFANLVDSLEAVRTVVYKNKTLDMKKMIEHIKMNYRDENVRNIFTTQAAKYGNGISKTDELACEIYEKICVCLNNYQSAIDGNKSFHPQFFSFSDNQLFGEYTSATPDGRYKGDFLSYGVAPMNGCDINGYKAVLNSASALPTVMAAGNTSLIVDMAQYVFSETNLDRIIDLYMDASQRGLCSTIFNLINPQELKQAMCFPEKYPDVYVNVSGFSRRFCSFSENVRRSIVQRTNHISV